MDIIKYEKPDMLIALKLLGNNGERLTESQIDSIKQECKLAGDMASYIAVTEMVGSNLSAFNQGMDKAVVAFGILKAEDVWDIAAKHRRIASAYIAAKAELEAKLASPPPSTDKKK
jgi:hypothetical protein